jgi:fluoride ion exporter CrcB/FEX
MQVLVGSMAGLILRWLHQERAQNTFEYMLVVGAVVVAAVGAMIAGFELLLPQVAGLVCPSVDTAANPIATIGSCLNSIGG